MKIKYCVVFLLIGCLCGFGVRYIQQQKVVADRDKFDEMCKAAGGNSHTWIYTGRFTGTCVDWRDGTIMFDHGNN